MTSRLLLRLAPLCALALPASAGAQPYPTPEQTRAEFDALCRSERESSPFFGSADVDDALARLESSPGAPGSRAQQRGPLAFQLVRLGRFDEALEQIELAKRELAENDRQMRLDLLSVEAIALYLQGEDRNCVAFHSAASCILPIRPEAVHRDKEATRKAGDLYLELLQANPRDVQARWLLNLARLLTADYPQGVPERFRLPEGAFEPEGAFPHWIDIAPRLGVDAFDLAGGALMDDFDGDGNLDLISSSWDPCSPLRAFRNDGEGGFEDVSETWGLSAQLGGLNLIHADYDDDGHLDVLVLRGGWLGAAGRQRNSLLRNDLEGETGRFVDVTIAAGIAYPAYPTQTAAFADYDLDGDLDLYVGNESDASEIDPLALEPGAGRAYPSQLFRNDGVRDGVTRFTNVSRRAGVMNLSYAKGVAWGDVDDDGDPDLFVSNIGPNRLYRNDGDGTFTDIAEAAGLGGLDRNFATWFFDYDNDGDLDLYTSDYGAEVASVSASYFGFPTEGGNPKIYRNDGGIFTDVSTELGLTRPALPMGSNFGDLDADGWLDFYLGTGVPAFAAVQPNQVWRNAGGERFEERTFASGLGHLQKGHSVAFGDLDNDGDEDLYEQLGGAFPYDEYGNALYLNPSRGHRWITLRLRGSEANHFGVGARVHLEVERADGTRRAIHRVVGSGGSFGSSSLQQEIGLGDAARIVGLVIRWPGDAEARRYEPPALDATYVVRQNDAALRKIETPPIRFRLRPEAHPANDSHHEVP